MKKSLALGIALACASLTATGAAATTTDEPGPALQLPAEAAVSAASLAVSEPSSGGSSWEFSSTAYLWMSGIHGEVDVPGEASDIDIDKSFTDLLGDLQLGYMGAFNVRKGRFVGLTDTMFMHLESKTDGFTSADFVDAEVDQKVLMSTIMAGYRAVDQGPLSVDLMAGIRRVKLKVDVDLEGPLQTREVETSSSKVSPVIGARFNVPLAEKWGLMVYGDASSLVSKSMIKWQLAGTVHYRISDKWRVGAGYRYMKLSRNWDEVELDMSLNGPLIAFTHMF